MKSVDMDVHSFRTIHPVPGMAAGAYYLGKSDIKSIEWIDQGFLVHFEDRGNSTKKPCVFTWANISWYKGTIKTPSSASKRQK